jgi:hypothetical protein
MMCNPKEVKEAIMKPFEEDDKIEGEFSHHSIATDHQ